MECPNCNGKSFSPLGDWQDGFELIQVWFCNWCEETVEEIQDSYSGITYARIRRE